MDYEETETECAERMRRIREDFKSSYEAKKSKPKMIAPISSPLKSEMSTILLGLMYGGGKAEAIRRMYGGVSGKIPYIYTSLGRREVKTALDRYKKAADYSGTTIGDLANRVDCMARDLNRRGDEAVEIALHSPLAVNPKSEASDKMERIPTLISSRREADYIMKMFRYSVVDADFSSLEAKMTHAPEWKGVWFDEAHLLKPKNPEEKK